MKTKLLLPILLLIAILVSTSIQQVQKPNCSPVSSTKTYKDTLFVFLVESHGAPNSFYMHYLMKQLACSIPKASNIKAFILDYTDENAAIQTSFYDSDGMVGKIPSSVIGAVSQGTPKCDRMKKVQESFSQLPDVQSKNVKYVALYATGVCPQPSGVTDWVQIDIEQGQNNKIWFMVDGRPAGWFAINEDNAPQLLIDASKTIIGKALGDNSMVPADAQANCSNNENPMEFNTLAIIVTVIAVILGIVVLVLVIVICVICKKGKKGSDGTKDKKKKKKKGNESSSSGDNTTGTTSSLNPEKKKKNKNKEPAGVHDMTPDEENGIVKMPGDDSIATQPKST